MLLMLHQTGRWHSTSLHMEAKSVIPFPGSVLQAFLLRPIYAIQHATPLALSNLPIEDMLAWQTCGDQLI